ncbi:MAG TPA: fumarylacetoacetate hydrolase family protein [Polyangia bacterium]|nr:fumarylacetoacetate hydrolase family protein [Polyangia bacterium]
MKLFRHGPPGAERPGAFRGEVAIDASGFGGDFDERFFATDGLRRFADWFAHDGVQAPRVADGVRLGPPVSRPSKIVCIGLNYRDHARETGAPLPAEPIVFLKAPSALAGPNDDLPLPAGAEKLDFEVELGLVIGKRAKNVAVEQALEHVAGFVLHNDYSERAFQIERGGQWVKGKSGDGFAPLGPHLVTRDAFPGFAAARLWLTVNGETRQDSSTAEMIFDVPTLVSYVSRFMTLVPGDVISTGTPAGVGMGRKPPVYLRAGDVVEYGIDGLGKARQTILESSL